MDNSILIAQVEELAKILKPWNEQIVIGGGVALILYDTILSKVHAGAVGTTDIDFLIPRKPAKIGDGRISTVLLDNGYEPRNKTQDLPSVQSFIKQVEGIEIEVEFLTDNKSRFKEDVVEVKEAGVNAQALSYIEMSLSEVTPLQLANGEKITVVRPEAWVFHKGLTFTKRTVTSKKYKDLYGIWFVLTQLGDTSFAVKKALGQLMAKNPEPWGKKFHSNLDAWVAAATPQDWSLLQSQDINGRLTQDNFLGALKSIQK